MTTPAHRSTRLTRCSAMPIPRAMSGFTLVELIVAVVIIAILIALAAPAFAALITSQRASTAASDLYLALTVARSEATKRATNVTLSPATGGWKNGWVIVDPAATSTNVLAHGAVAASTITGPDTVVFQRSGRVQGSTSPSFTLTLSSGSTTSKKCVLTDLSGRPYVKSC